MLVSGGDAKAGRLGTSCGDRGRKKVELRGQKTAQLTAGGATAELTSRTSITQSLEAAAEPGPGASWCRTQEKRPGWKPHIVKLGKSVQQVKCSEISWACCQAVSQRRRPTIWSSSSNTALYSLFYSNDGLGSFLFELWLYIIVIVMKTSPPWGGDVNL